MVHRQKPEAAVWHEFQGAEGLTEKQLALFQRYKELLLAWNQDINLTAITDLTAIIRQHFQDSLALKHVADVATIRSILDIGAGAGFPSLPLKIMYPHLQVYLLEVTKKKQRFLAEVIQQLGLTGVEIIDCDWRTFLRTTEYELDYCVTRAALPDLELIRMFKPACAYRKTHLVYWASEEWEPHKKSAPYIKQDVAYVISRRRRRLIVFGENSDQLTSEEL